MNRYNSDVNIIGGIPDYQLIVKAIELYTVGGGAMEDAIVRRNEFDFKTENARKRFLAAVTSTFLNFQNKDHEELITNLFSHQMSLETQQLILFWQFSLSNRLFYEISRDVFIKNYFSGRVSFAKEDIVAYIKDLGSTTPEMKDKFTDITINTIASKYLTVLKKLDLIEGKQKKTFKHIQVSNEALVIFLHLLKTIDPSSANILKNKYSTLSMVSPESFAERVKQLAKKDYFNMSFNGVALKIEPIHTNKRIADVLFK
ncbi:MAG: DUF1819 family protein [Sulfurimonas sp.]